MTNVVETLSTNIPTTLFLLGVTLVMVFILSLMMGNVTSMKLLSKLGVTIFSGKPDKDYKLVKSINEDTLGWINVPNTCYSPIMQANQGYYKNKDYKGRESKYGEIVLNEGEKMMNLSSLAKPSTNDNLFKDLTMIKGSASNKTSNIRDCKFTFLKKYLNSDLKRHHPDIVVIDNGKKRIFNLLFAVEMKIEDRKTFVMRDRDSFISSLREIAFVDTGKGTENDIIILNGSTSIDTVLVFLVEKEEQDV